MSFSGFSEEELQRIKSGETGTGSGPKLNPTNVKKLDKIGFKPKRVTNQYKMPPVLQKVNSDDAIDSMQFDKCKLSLKSPVKNNTDVSNFENKENIDKNDNISTEINKELINEVNDVKTMEEEAKETSDGITTTNDRKESIGGTPDVVRGVENYSEDELVNHKVKLEELQLRQKLMEEQNKKRKEMLAKALADRTKQTAEEVMRLEKIKKELQILDSQFSQDVAVLRGKIDHACLSYADAEKHYLKVEKEFLQAKINLQKEREKKELLTEHLCALITHNETRKAQKLETLMLELATDKKYDIDEPSSVDDEKPVIVDGVDVKSGKIVEFTPES